MAYLRNLLAGDDPKLVEEEQPPPFEMVPADFAGCPCDCNADHPSRCWRAE